MITRQRVPQPAALRLTVFAGGVASLLLAAGCQVAPDSRAESHSAEPAHYGSARYMTLDEFSTVVAGDGEVTLVEFCVPTGCARCDQMRRPIDGLANNPGRPLNVRRVNLRQYPALAWEFGVTVCPSYIAFQDGQEVFRAAHPTSADLIAVGIEDALYAPSPDQVTLAATPAAQ